VKSLKLESGLILAESEKINEFLALHYATQFKSEIDEQMNEETRSN
jgi:hypothetical protein